MKPIRSNTLFAIGALFLFLLLVPATLALAEDAPKFEVGGPLEPAPATARMTIVQAVILGVVEGVTEYLPVSSTGHLTVVERLLGMGRTTEEKSALDAYTICIQAGAIIAVFLISFGRIRRMVAGIFGRDRDGLRLLLNLVVATIPAAIIGLLLEAKIKQYLYGLWPVTAAWLIGGLLILLLARKRKGTEGNLLESLTWQQALVIGLAQSLALWPGVSRSLVTMAGGMLLGLSVSAAVEFSFLLGLVTLGAATIYEGVKAGPEIIRIFGWVSPAIGLVVAAGAAFVAVKAMVGYLRTRSLEIFGWYRIGIAILVVFLIYAKVV
jgi:undecaprenyl-diphosphatase